MNMLTPSVSVLPKALGDPTAPSEIQLSDPGEQTRSDARQGRGLGGVRPSSVNAAHARLLPLATTSDSEACFQTYTLPSP